MSTPRPPSNGGREILDEGRLVYTGVGAEAARSGSEVYSAISIVVALMAFAGTVLVARFVEWRDVE